MAKTKLNNMEEESLKSNENPMGEREEDVVVGGRGRAAEEIAVVTGVKKVKIQVIEKVDCLVARVPYQLEKGKVYSVPSDVAAVLCNANKAYRI